MSGARPIGAPSPAGGRQMDAAGLEITHLKSVPGELLLLLTSAPDEQLTLEHLNWGERSIIELGAHFEKATVRAQPAECDDGVDDDDDHAEVERADGERR